MKHTSRPRLALGISSLITLLMFSVVLGSARPLLGAQATKRPRAAVTSQARPPAKKATPAAKKKVAPRKTTGTKRAVRRVAPKPPKPLDPTLGDDPSGEDLVVRQAAIDALGNLNGSMVAVDPNTGRILTILNQKLAFAGGYQPCSTFKPAVALAALQEGVISNDHNRLRLGQRWYMTLEESLARSNNVYFEKLGAMLGLSRLRKYAEAFGFSDHAGWGIEQEQPGSFPEKPPPASMGGVGRIASFGQGISQTLLQEVAFVSTVANGGTLYYLQYPKSPEEIENFQPRIKRQLDLSPWLKPVRDGMLGAVLFGTARRAQQPDIAILGKTGTCSQNGYRLGWFAGYSEYESGLAVAVLQRTPQPMGGGPHAAEIAGRFFRQLADKKYSLRRPEEHDGVAPGTLPASIQLFR